METQRKVEIQTALYGKSEGDFRVATRGLEHVSRILKHHASVNGLERIYSPQCTFTRVIANESMTEPISDPFGQEPWLFRTPAGADGMMVRGRGKGVVIFNADCPIVALADVQEEILCVLHAGTKCVHPNTSGTPSIVTKAIQFFKRREFVSAFVGLGIGDCCYGYPAAVHDLVLRPFAKTATLGPRKGRSSLDLYSLLLRQLVRVGIPASQIRFEPMCTAHSGRAGRHSEEEYHSNVWDEDSTATRSGRNAALIWLE